MSGLRELHDAEFRRDFHLDLLLLLAVFAIGVIVGWRSYYLSHDYAVRDCTEDEWISPETGECVHVEEIVNQNLSDLG